MILPSNQFYRFILDENNLKINLIDYVVFYEKPFLKFERLLETYLLRAPIGFNFLKSYAFME